MQQSSDQVLAIDMRQNMAAGQAGAVLVRVHSRDLSSCDSVQAALLAATSGCCIVLTPAYATETYSLDGWNLSYVCALWLLMPNCYYDFDQYGNCRFWTG